MQRHDRPTRTTEHDLLALPPRALEALYGRHPTATLPDGRAEGTVLLLSGTPAARPLAALVRALAWRGKVVDAARGRLTNLVGPTGAPGVPAEVFPGPSLVDGADCVVIDYARTSRVARRVRDEVREVAPGLWLGVAHLSGRRVGWFALRFPSPAGPTRSSRGR